MTRIIKNIVSTPTRLKTGLRRNIRRLVKTLPFHLDLNVLVAKVIDGHMKPECRPYLKSTGKSKALVATLSDTELDNDPEEKFITFITTIEKKSRLKKLVKMRKSWMSPIWRN